MGIVIAGLRPMADADVPAVHRLEETIFPQPWSEGILRDELAAPNRHYLVAEAGGEVVGYGGLMRVEEDAHITTLGVRPESRENGLGTRLLLALADRALEAGSEHLTLEVRVGNLLARRLYARFGFAPVGLRRNYYLDEDALIMWATDIAGEEYRERLERIREGRG